MLCATNESNLKTVLIIGLIATLQSCCPFIKEEHLGNNLYLSEYDNVDRRILYSKESCAASGVEIVPMTVLEYDYDSKWIIAKSGNKRENSNIQYWIIKNDFDDEGTSKVIKSKTIGPLDLGLFSEELTRRQIQLKLKKIE